MADKLLQTDEAGRALLQVIPPDQLRRLQNITGGGVQAQSGTAGTEGPIGRTSDSPPPKRPRVQLKSFAYFGAASPSLHFYVLPKPVDELMQRLNDLRWLVMCSGCRTGKSTICAALKAELQHQGHEVASILLGDDIPVDDVEDFWAYMHKLLHVSNSDRFPDPRPVRPSSATFMHLFDKKQPRVWVLVDEASQLASLQDNVLVDFLTTIRTLRNRWMAQHSLEGMPLFGVYSIVRLLQGHNRNASAIRVADLADAGHFSQQDIQSLLEQYVTQQQQINPSSNCLQQQDLPNIARSLYDLTSGHKGLIGTCCHLLDHHLSATAEQWRKFSAVSLSRRVGSHGSFARILGALHFVYPPRGLAANETPAQQDRRKAQQEAMYDAVYKGSHVIPQQNLPLLQEVLEEGILVPQRTIDGASSPLLVLDKVTLKMPCPLMASCVLQGLYIDRCERWNHDFGGLNLVGDLLMQVVHNINPQVLSMRQTSKADGSTSECALQAETYMLAAGIMRKRPESYIVLPEAHQHDIKKFARFRVGFVVTSKEEAEPLEPFGMELLLAGNCAQIDAHVMRAQMCSQLHAVSIGDAVKPCQMLVVNFLTTAAQQQQQQLEGLYFPAALQSKDGPVRMAHVLMMESATHASIQFGPGHGHDAFHLASVPISSSTESGRERVYWYTFD
eukprot:GHUV01008004.1.p1 GENE.GHUV01008004.1~~GHUV01008004.1.p1  ORF type:complete len:672 (+),score=170.34 GHUV01008004.1:794-2809(+)